ncbi:LPS assembly lipoprotein LptE [Thioclava atlantica]|uniref:Lipoprotein n=1 Tax=Thioclava atlantica TaxID=1317124 RepID=A0A085TTK9_9RHOB|nr:LPS assembly lipoprotein LptE [Thioclava atlantica]KFE34056.1 lipoprotein [Thioclava atlantica]
MWSSDRRTFLRLAGVFALAGCGFTPAYGPQGGAAKLLGGVEPDAPETRDAFELVQHLKARLGPADPQRYRLSYTISTEAIGEGIAPDNSTTRYQLNGQIDYTLRDAASDAVLLTGRVNSFTSWSATGTVLASDAAREDAHRRLMRILGDQIVTRLLAQASSLPQ